MGWGLSEGWGWGWGSVGVGVRVRVRVRVKVGIGVGRRGGKHVWCREQQLEQQHL